MTSLVLAVVSSNLKSRAVYTPVPGRLQSIARADGQERNPVACRENTLSPEIHAMLPEDFANRVVPSDSGAARARADVATTRRLARRPVSRADCQVAAIARSRGTAVATRNVRDFEDMVTDIHNSWTKV